MLESENCSQEEDCLSLCSSCKSELRSIFSIGVPSFIISTCGTSTSQNHSQEIANDETMQLDSVLKTHSSNKSLVYLSSKELMKNLAKNANNSLLQSPLHVDDSNCVIENQAKIEERNTSINVTLSYEAQKVDNVTYKRVYGCINLKDRTTIIDDSRNVREKPILTNPFKSCRLNNMQETKSPLELKQPAFNTHSLKGSKETCNTLSKTNAKVQAMTASNALDSRNSINHKTTETDLKTRRRNVYKLADRVSNLSAYIRNVHKILLKKNLKDRKKMNEDIIKEASRNKINAIKFNNRSNNLQDLPMYTYNPLRAKRVRLEK
nr:PREDICTED: uncharacterized protein LOC105673353 [Linepithema humile]